MITFSEFLTNHPCGSSADVTNLAQISDRGFASILCAPTIRLYCPNEACDGERNFDGGWDNGNVQAGDVATIRRFLEYRCRDCHTYRKVFCIEFNLIGTSGWITKIGEVPAASDSMPPHLRKALGPHYDWFNKGLRCERDGCGIGAFAYYRRVVEAERDRLFDELARAAETVPGTEDLVKQLKAAKEQIQFKQSLSSINAAFPPTLMIGGQNPLLLLHSALSQTLHSETDESAMEAAIAIRLVLCDLVDRMKLMLRDTSDVKKAVSKLLEKGRLAKGGK